MSTNYSLAIGESTDSSMTAKVTKQQMGGTPLCISIWVSLNLRREKSRHGQKSQDTQHA
jgi:hypothetical protein